LLAVDHAPRSNDTHSVADMTIHVALDISFAASKLAG